MKKIFLFLLLILFISNTSALYWNSSMNDDLLAVWNMNDTSTYQTDLVTGTYNLTGVLGGSSVECGLLNKCISIDSVNSRRYFHLSESPMTNPNVTIMIWFNSSDAVTQHDLTLWSDASGLNRLQYLSGGGGRLLATLGNINVVNVVGDTKNLFEPNVSTMITLTYDDTANLARVYINNTLVNESTTAFTVSTSQDFYIGNDFLLSRQFVGMFSDIKVWNKSLTLNEITAQYNDNNGLEYNVYAPTNTIDITLNSPENDYQASSSTIYFTATYLGNNVNLTNSTLYIWNGTNNLYAINTTEINGTVNDTNHSISNIATGVDYKWYVYVCGNNVTDNLCFYSNNRTFSLNVFALNNSYYSPYVYETSNAFFEQNITINSGYSVTNAVLYYNGVGHTSTKTCTSTSCNIKNYIDIPTISGASTQNFSFYYNYTITDGLTTTVQSTNISNQTVREINFTLCSTTPLNTPYLNISFKDEATSLYINASITSSTFLYRLGNGGYNKTYSFSNLTNNPEYNFCASPNNQTFNVDTTLNYKQGTTYTQRTWNPTITSYTSTLTNQILYLLSVSDGQYVTYQVVNNADQTISGVSVTATRSIDGSSTTIGSGTTDDAGTITFWLNPDIEHNVCFVKTGYSTYCINQYPTQTSYTITLGDSITIPNSTIQGIIYNIFPTNTYLLNNTAYTFGINLTSSTYTIESYGFNLRLADGTIVTGSSSSVEGANAQISYNTNNQTIIYMDYYWKIGDSYTNATIYWTVQNTEYTRWSIATFFTDLSTYLNSGIFGLDNFGRSLIIFIIIFVLTGFMTFKYGISSPIGVMTIIFGVVFFLDIGVNIIPSIRGIDNLLTYITGLVLVLTLLSEVRQR